MTNYLMLAPLLLFMAFSGQEPKPIRYIALGDSYTICTGTSSAAEQWPNLLAAHLSREGIPVEAVSNPSRNGFSTQQLIEHELPLLKTGKYDLATLLIGVNDWVRETDIGTYHKNLCYIIDEIQKALPDKHCLVLITIPDFGVTPNGALYGGERDISKGISAFNAVIKAEAKKRGLACADIFPVSQGMLGHSELVAADGLHPSAREYALWEPFIFGEVRNVLTKK